MPKDAGFCRNCGERAAPETEVAATRSHPQRVSGSETKTNPSRKPMRLKTKILFLTVVLLLIVVIGTHLFLKNMYNPDRKIEAMNTAYNTQDKEAFFKQFDLKKGTTGSADHFYTFVKKYGWTDLRDQLDTEVVKATNGGKSTNIISMPGELISVVSKPTVFGLYHDVTFTILPTDVTVQVPFKETTFTFGDQEFKTSADEEMVKLGSFIPGEYAWSYETTGNIMPLKGKGSYKLESTEDNSETLDIDWNVANVTIESNVNEAIVYIDGKSTEKTVKELHELYPAQLNKKVNIHAVTKNDNGKEVSSDILPMTDDYVYLTFDHVAKQEAAKEEQEQQKRDLSEQEQWVKEMYNDFRSSYSYAIDSADFSYIQNYFADGSKIKADYAKFVSDHDAIPGYYYQFILNDVTSVQAISDTRFELYSFETFNYSSNEDPTLHYERKKKYVFIKINDEFFIESITDLDTKKTKL